MIKIKFDLNNEEVYLTSNKLNTLIVENKEYYRDLIKSLYFEYLQNDNSLFTFYKDDSILDFDSNISVIFNIFSLDLNSKKNINYLYRIIKKTYYDKLDEDINNIKQKALEIIKEISLDLNIELDMNNEIKTEDLFKMFDIKIKDNEEILLKRLINYMFVMQELQKYSIFVIIHLKEYFSDKEILDILKECAYKDIILFDIETINETSNILKENKIIIDKDCCVIK